MIGTNPKIVIADDHPGFRQAVLDFLPETRQPVIECSDGHEAIAAYEEYLPDLVIMDIDMPHLDGLSATRNILARFPEALVVVLTLHDSPEVRLAALEAGATAFLSKSELGDLYEFLTTQANHDDSSLSPPTETHLRHNT